MCFVHCVPRARIPSTITAPIPTLALLSQNCIAFHAATTIERPHRDRATVRGHDSCNVKKTTDIVAYETHETRALHCAALQDREHGAVHDGDHVWRHVERGLQRIANQGLFGRFALNSLKYDGVTPSTIGLGRSAKLLGFLTCVLNWGKSFD